METVNQTINLSSFFAKRAIKIFFPDAMILPIETNNSDICNSLDKDLGIDYLIKLGANKYEISSRVQFCNYKTFTIRYKLDNGSENTEWKKRVDAYNKGYYLPDFTMHVYFDSKSKDANFLHGAIIKTSELIESFLEGGYYENKAPDGNIFRYKSFASIKSPSLRYEDASSIRQTKLF